MNPLFAQEQPPVDKFFLYQIFTRVFSNQNTTNKFYGTLQQNGTGKFNDINDKALNSIKELGITHVWYTGVIEHAMMTDYQEFGINASHPQVVKGIAGSPYAIRDYYGVNPDLAVNVPQRMKEFEDLVVRTHDAGLKVVIDFVPNHVAREYKSTHKPDGYKDLGEDDDTTSGFLASNNFYYFPEQHFHVPEGGKPPLPYSIPYEESPAKATGNDVFSSQPNINDWFETIKINYGVDYLNGRQKHFDPIPDTWIKMKDILLFWAQKGVDGFRCDMVQLTPLEFWAWVIPEIKKQHPHVIFIAEIYVVDLYRSFLFEGKFDYLYDKVGLYDALRRLIEGNGNANDITNVWQNESGDFSNRMLRFLENHDEQRINSSFFCQSAEIALPAMMLSATLHTGPVMIYAGQELGVEPKDPEGFQGDDGRTTIFDYWGLPEMQGWINAGKWDAGKLTATQKTLRNAYKNILHFAQENEAVRSGNFFDLQYLNHNDEYDSSKSYAYLRYSKGQMLLFVFNFDQHHSKSFALNLPVKLIQERFIDGFDLFENSKKLKIDAEAILKYGLPVKIKPNSYRIFELK